MGDRTGRPSYVIGPQGTILTLDDLPSEATMRWVKRRKAEILAAVRGGLLSLDDACARYQITVEEFLSWRDMIDPPAITGHGARMPGREKIDEKVELLLHQAKHPKK